jgi:hypothetical protein
MCEVTSYFGVSYCQLIWGLRNIMFCVARANSRVARACLLTFLQFQILPKIKSQRDS